jgi:hypothetical protein
MKLAPGYLILSGLFIAERITIWAIPGIAAGGGV